MEEIGKSPTSPELSGRLRSALAQAAGPADGTGGPTGTRAALLSAGRARRQRRRMAGAGGVSLAALVGLALVVTLAGPGTSPVRTAAGPLHAGGSSPSAAAPPTAASCVEVSVASGTGACRGNLATVATPAPTATARISSSGASTPSTTAPAEGIEGPPAGPGGVQLTVGQRLVVTLPAALGHWSGPVALSATALQQTFASQNLGAADLTNGVSRTDSLRYGQLRLTQGARRAPIRSVSFVAVKPGLVLLRATTAGHRWTLTVTVRPPPP